MTLIDVEKAGLVKLHSLGNVTYGNYTNSTLLLLLSSNIHPGEHVLLKMYIMVFLSGDSIGQVARGILMQCYSGVNTYSTSKERLGVDLADSKLSLYTVERGW